MKILVACETTGVIRRALRARGHIAISCDLLPSKDNSPHHRQCDVRHVVGEGWDGLVFHPDCTYLTSAAEWAYGDGPYHQRVKPGTLVGAARRAAREQAFEFAMWGMELPIEFKVMENPVGALSSLYRTPDITVQPYHFGDDASKRTCLWLSKLPPPSLPPRELWHPGRHVEWPKGSGKMVQRWSNQTDSGQNRLPPGADRWDVRSATYPGIGNAVADLFGNLYGDLC